ncbi:T9SS type A sorting domain-containing protein [Hymenobacter ruricola]|uniref:T9SS type A sorting domain-containing protein n=1 Tax=Hymenobacter ruricola TaxID=2791023 RepID=A0ABS0IAC5_9BACT|nr:T9SS type A sorting domain-containing protein [Hymenobacter ruricola]MBF9223913.1 T9SS type A sorting domain-containing protein [Hymenobacter ruricola]
MKQLFAILLVVLLVPVVTMAQSPPGWGWVTQIGTYVPNSVGENKVVGLGRDAAGNLYQLGTYEGTPAIGGQPTTNAGETDVFLAKYSPTGALLWLRTLQSPGFEAASALVVEPSGRCTLAGSFGGGPAGANLGFFGFSAGFSLAGPAVWGLPTTPLGYGSVPFLAAVDAAGALLWADVPSPTYGVGITALHRDGAGNCYLSVNMRSQSQLLVNGQAYPPIGISDAVLVKYTPAGQPAWARRLGASGGFTSSGGVKTDAAGAVYWTISHSQNLLLDGRVIPVVTSAVPVAQGSNTLVKVDANNVVRWTKNSLLKRGTANAQGEVLFIDQTDNTLYLGGGSYGGTVTNPEASVSLAVPTGSYGTCIARCDTSGAVQWLRPFAFASTVPNGAGWAAVGPINFFPDATGYTALTSTAYAAQTVFPPNNTFDFSKNGLPCVVRYTYATNQFDWIRTGGIVGSFPGTSLGSTAVASVVDASGNVYVTGTFTGVAQFGAITAVTASPYQPEIFLAKLDQSVLTAARPAAAGRAWSVFPNPSPGTAQLAGLPAEARVRVYDALGRLVRELPAVATAAAPRTLERLPAGLYLLQVTHTAEPYRSQRLLVE